MIYDKQLAHNDLRSRSSYDNNWKDHEFVGSLVLESPYYRILSINGHSHKISDYPTLHLLPLSFVAPLFET